MKCTAQVDAVRLKLGHSAFTAKSHVQVDAVRLKPECGALAATRPARVDAVRLKLGYGTVAAIAISPYPVFEQSMDVWGCTGRCIFGPWHSSNLRPAQRNTKLALHMPYHGSRGSSMRSCPLAWWFKRTPQRAPGDLCYRLELYHCTALTRQLLHRTTPLASLERSPWPVGRLPYPLS